MCMLVPQVASGSDSQAFDNKLRIANERKSIKLSATSGKQQEGARSKNMKCDANMRKGKERRGGAGTLHVLLETRRWLCSDVE